MVKGGSSKQINSVSGLQIRVRTGILLAYFSAKTYVVGTQKNYSKEPSQCDGSFVHPKHIFKLMGKEINANLGAQNILIWT